MSQGGFAVFKRPPCSRVSDLGLTSNYMLLGEEEKARFQADEVLKANPSFSLKTFQSKNLYKNPADIEHRLEPLRKAGIPE